MPRPLRAVLGALIASLVLAVPAGAAAPAVCPGDPMVPDRVITGEFDRGQQGGYVQVPFDVPAGTTSVRVKYCHDQPESPTSAELKHTLDLGLYDSDSFRGWGGSSHPDVTITPQGFSSEEQYKANPKGHVPGRTTRGYRPGPIPGGRWAAELGVAAVVSQAEGDADGKVAWRVEVDVSSDPAFAADPYQPAAYDTRPARGAQDWYAGDLHVHAEHSALGDATMSEVFDYAFGEAKLDFVMLSDYVTDSAWSEIGRYQPRYGGNLIGRSAEVITYRGHTNNHGSAQYVDYRTGPVWERRDDGSLIELRGPRPPREIFDAVHAPGGWTQVNHPTIFPSDVPGFSNLCRGCPWDYSDEETDWSKVDSYEVSTGPAGFGTPVGSAGPNPFTLTAIEEWDDLWRRGFPVTGVGVSDSHHAGRTNNPVTQTPVGDGHTVVFADELSEDGVRRAVQAGHAYVKLFGADSPDLRFSAKGGGRQAIMGDALPGRRASFEARVIGARQGSQLVVMRDGRPVQAVPVVGGDFTHEFTGSERGHYRLQVQRESTIDALTNPISLGFPPRRAPAGPSGAGANATLVLRATPSRVRAGTRGRFTFTVRTRAGARLSGVRVRFNGRSVVTDSRGVGRIVTRLARPRVYRARATAPEYRSDSAGVRALPRGVSPSLTG